MKFVSGKTLFLFLLVAVILSVALAYIFLPSSQKDPADTGRTVDGKTTGIRAVNSPTPGSHRAPPSLEQLQSNPLALHPAPLELNFGSPPFERQANGTIYKKDVMKMLEELNDESQEASSDLQLLAKVIGAYHRIFQQNPVAGENREVVEALTGKNPHKLIFLSPRHPALNEHLELIDRWGNPFLFHPVSSSLMEFSSAGPDGNFGTADDITLQDEEPPTKES